MNNIENFDKFSTPIFIYDLSSIKKRIEEIKTAFKGVSYTQYYPVKANPNLEIVRHCIENEIGIDVCSLGDMVITNILNVPPNKISFTGNALSENDMRVLHSKNIAPNLCSLEQIKRWAALFPGTRIGIRVSTRIPGTNIQGNYSLKMGVFYEEWPIIRDIVLRNNLEITRLHRHESKNTIIYSELLEDFSSAFTSIPPWVWNNVNAINFGGGWGIPYLREGKLDIEKLASGIIDITRKIEHSFGLNSLKIEIEPGEFLVGESGYLLTTVADVRNFISQEKKENLQVIILDTPFPVTSGSRSPELSSQVVFDFNDTNNLKDLEEIVSTIIYGRSNTSMDTIIKGIYTQHVKVGDYALISDVGAYVPVLLSHFNEQDIPAESIFKNGELMKSRNKVEFESHYKKMYLKGEYHE